MKEASLSKEEKKAARKAAKEDKKRKKEEAKQPAKDPEKKAKEREWADVNEQLKFVIHGGKAQCPFASPAIADIIVTSNTVMLQDKPFATIKDKDGKVNFNFTGVCNHPSQKRSSSPPPPCKSVINLGEWENFSETMINDDNALLVKSTIKCNVSGQDLKITHSGQMAELTDIKPRVKKEPKIIEIYWSYGEDCIRLKNKSRHYSDLNVHVITRDYDEGDQVCVTISANGKKKLSEKLDEITLSGSVNDNEVVFMNVFRQHTINL